MVKRIIHHLLRHRHFWRDASFDELSELYASMVLRSLAIGMIGVFVPVYMYQLGHTISDIVAVYAWFATAQVAMSYATARYVARFGPKHTIILSYAAQLISSLLFLTQSMYHWPIFVLGITWGIAANLFFIAYHIDFSKVKHVLHSAQEVGYMYIMQRVGLAAGPLLGGVVATIWHPRYTFLAAALLLLIGLIPLLRTSEPIRTRQRLDFSGFPVRKALRDFGAYGAFAAEDILLKLVWPAFVGIFVLSSAVYVKLGALTSISVIVSIVTTYALARIVDKRHGRRMLRSFVVANSAVHCIRPFVATTVQVIGVNVLNDVVTTGYTLPFIKGMYSAADELPGYRIVYVASMEMMGSMGRACVCWLLFIISTICTLRLTLMFGFILAGIASLLILSERFRILRPAPGKV